ncbi:MULTISPECIES: GNAT family protein [unclassified Sinorhizobium]|uniref:GNAT family N-acetyltransferase n=1 Tax=unclassified Sinorhizobium TaxID=2613772 RepID=UPI0024C2633C|nr:MULTISPECIES: GNAT family protein [unclassified Sinorhizobium]MDK1378368.1 GNAT family protein [Sinorhizobium sp. 6-70]MDK1482085.1 GNAT family protein [Sinorhizobium sp. 6-117]
MKVPPILEGPNIRLRPPCEADIETRFLLGSDPDIAEMFGVSREDVRPITRERAAGWVSNLVEQPHAWIIEIQGTCAGEIRLDRVDQHDRRASMAIGIFNSALLGHGFGSEAIHLLLRHAFGPMGLHRIGIRVLSYNERAIRAYEKCGFVVEGREREAAFVNGTWHDDIMMGLLDREFLDRPAPQTHDADEPSNCR